MSMNATDAAVSDSATRRATVDFPEPVPPAMPMINGFVIGRSAAARGSRDSLVTAQARR